MKKRNKITGEPGSDPQQPADDTGAAADGKSETREEILVRLGNRVIEARGKLGLKQKDFAKELGVSSSYLSDIELGKTRPSFDFLISCYRKYKLNLSWLLVGDGLMFLNRESGKKVCEYDFGDQSEVMHDMLGMMEKSLYCRNVLAASLLRTYYENETIIKRDLKRETDKLD